MDGREMETQKDIHYRRRLGRRVLLFIYDTVCFLVVDGFYYLLAIRAANSMPVDDLGLFIVYSVVQLGLLSAARLLLEVYRNIWRYANTYAYFELVLADVVSWVTTFAVLRLINQYNGLWQIIVVGALTTLFALTSRFGYGLIYRNRSRGHTAKLRVPAAIVGAGRLGASLAADLQDNPNSGLEPMFFLDTDTAKIGNRISGLEVYSEEVASMLISSTGVREIIIAIANGEQTDIADLYFRYQELGCNVRVYDSLVPDGSGKAVLRDFSIDDLLFRKPKNVLDADSLKTYTGKTILVTGGGGSIGSELCRQLAACAPKTLVIYDIYENNAYDIQQELKQQYGTSLDLQVEIGSVRDQKRLEAVFSAFRPQIVFHAAAHKHVPLMEHCPAEAVKNNVLGTANTADMAEKYGVEKFILISTDKAVNPTNIMGATKRLCEMLIQCRSDSKTAFSAVRFGNVLGSNGSVVPLFRRQIAAGGPVTVTDKRIIRYFMTIPEAAQLVLKAGAMASAGELFVLDMGKPVKIYDLACNMIRLSGFEPEKDIMIQETGLRPGEKLYEELLIQSENLSKTADSQIFVERDDPLSREEMAQRLAQLRILTEETAASEDQRIHSLIAELVPTFCSPDIVNQRAADSAEMKLAAE